MAFLVTKTLAEIFRIFVASLSDVIGPVNGVFPKQSQEPAKPELPETLPVVSVVAGHVGHNRVAAVRRGNRYFADGFTILERGDVLRLRIKVILHDRSDRQNDVTFDNDRELSRG